MNIAAYGFAIWETFYVTVLSTAFALVLGLPLGVLLVAGDKDGILPLPMTLGGDAVSATAAWYCIHKIKQRGDPREQIPKAALLAAAFFMGTWFSFFALSLFFLFFFSLRRFL